MRRSSLQVVSLVLVVLLTASVWYGTSWERASPAENSNSSLEAEPSHNAVLPLPTTVLLYGSDATRLCALRSASGDSATYVGLLYDARRPSAPSGAPPACSLAAVAARSADELGHLSGQTMFREALRWLERLPPDHASPSGPPRVTTVVVNIDDVAVSTGAQIRALVASLREVRLERDTDVVAATYDVLSGSPQALSIAGLLRAAQPTAESGALVAVNATVVLSHLTAGTRGGVEAWLRGALKLLGETGGGAGITVTVATTLMAQRGEQRAVSCGDACVVLAPQREVVRFEDSSGLCAGRTAAEGSAAGGVLVGTSNLLCPAVGGAVRVGRAAFRRGAWRLDRANEDALAPHVPPYIADEWQRTASAKPVVGDVLPMSRRRSALEHCPFGRHSLVFAMASSYIPQDIEAFLASFAAMATRQLGADAGAVPCTTLIMFVRDEELWTAMLQDTVLGPFVWSVALQPYEVAANCFRDGAATCRLAVFSAFIAQSLENRTVFPNDERLRFSADEIGIVLTVDTRDALFQGDPFSAVEAHEAIQGVIRRDEDFMVIFSEGAPVGWLNERDPAGFAVHRVWITDVYSEGFFRCAANSTVHGWGDSKSRPLPILNSGFMFGTLQAVSHYFTFTGATVKAVRSHAKHITDDVVLVDQAILFGLALVALPRHVPRLQIVIADPERWPVVRHLYQRASDIRWVRAESRAGVVQIVADPRDVFGPDGEAGAMPPYAIVHQLDRFPRLWMRMREWWNQQGVFRRTLSLVS